MALPHGSPHHHEPTPSALPDLNHPIGNLIERGWWGVLGAWVCLVIRGWSMVIPGVCLGVCLGGVGMGEAPGVGARGLVGGAGAVWVLLVGVIRGVG